MSIKISEQTNFTIDIKTLISILAGVIGFMSVYFALKSDIEEAKELPEAVIDRIEYDLKQEWQTKHIEQLEEKVDHVLHWAKEVDDELKTFKKK
jgi:hypothetical protein